MPQLDFFSISNQFLWGIFYFILFYLLINFFIVPSIFSSIFARQAIVSSSNSAAPDSVIYMFAAFCFFAFFLAELDEYTNASSIETDELENSFFFTIRSTLSFELTNTKVDIFSDLDSD